MWVKPAGRRDLHAVLDQGEEGKMQTSGLGHPFCLSGHPPFLSCRQHVSCLAAQTDRRTDRHKQLL